jgi:hypothetical protein
MKHFVAQVGFTLTSTCFGKDYSKVVEMHTESPDWKRVILLSLVMIVLVFLVVLLLSVTSLSSYITNKNCVTCCDWESNPVSRTMQVSSIRRFESAKGEKALLPESAGPYARSTGARSFRTLEKSKLGKAGSAPLASASADSSLGLPYW